MQLSHKLPTLIILIIAGTLSINAQSESGFGIKGGLNYGSNGNYFDSATNSYENPDQNIGYHVGIFWKIGNQFYVRPELVYTHTKSDFNNQDLNITKLDLPVLVGTKIIGPISAFAGPAFQYTLDTDFEGITVADIDNNFTVGFNFGFAVNFNNIGIDVRYERGFSDIEALIIENNIATNNRLDSRAEQLILSFSIKI